MKFSYFLENNIKFKTKSLGGLDTQFLLAPKLRLKYSQAKIASLSPYNAAVLALFYPNNKGDICFLLTKRASYKGMHSAQISFPGGKLEEKDNSKLETALRETFEEVGVEKNSVYLVREMTDVFIPPSNFLVTPFIGYCLTKPKFKINFEVESLIEVSVSELLDENSITTIDMETSYMKNTPIPCFSFKGEVVWGATAMILSEIKELLKLY